MIPPAKCEGNKNTDETESLEIPDWFSLLFSWKERILFGDGGVTLPDFVIGLILH